MAENEESELEGLNRVGVPAVVGGDPSLPLLISVTNNKNNNPAMETTRKCFTPR